MKRLLKALTEIFGAEIAEGGFIGMFSQDVSSSDVTLARDDDS